MKNLLIAIQLVLATTVFTQSQADDLIGVWLNEKGNGKVEFYKIGNQYFGKLIWIDPTEKGNKNLTDQKNPSPELRSRPIQNMEVISDLTFTENEWSNGSAYSPEMGKYFNCKVWMSDSEHLKVRGSWGWFYRTETWSRVL